MIAPSSETKFGLESPSTSTLSFFSSYVYNLHLIVCDPIQINGHPELILNVDHAKESKAVHLFKKDHTDTKQTLFLDR